MSQASLVAEKLESLGLRNVSVRGDEVSACCPFHPEDNPSWGVNVKNEGNYCFSCGQGFRGIEKLLEWIADKHGLEYEPLYRDIDITLDFYIEEEVEPRPLNINSLDFYEENYEYFKVSWGVDQETWRRRKLLIDPYNKTECYPIIDRFGNYWGCVERTPPSAHGRSRYHYPVGFAKSNGLIGENIRSEEVWVTEGVRDLCAIETKVPGARAVALGGAYPSDKQIDLLRGYDHVILCLDNDNAGKIATKRLIEKLPPSRLSIAQYKGKDPMEADDFEVNMPCFLF